MMKCKDVEFEVVVAPNEISADAAEHLLTCVTCQAFAEQHNGFEQQLAGVIDCEVPAGLRDSLRQQRGKSVRLGWRLPVSLAASFFVAMVSFSLFTSDPVALPIDRLLVEHFEHDGARSIKASTQINSQQLARMGEAFGVRVKLTEPVSFVEKCPIGDSYGLHMVYQYKNKPITLIYMPDIPLEETVSFYYAGLKGWVKPMPKGSLAVLGGSTSELPEQDFTNEAMEWL